jgi:hypothetical protein
MRERGMLMKKRDQKVNETSTNKKMFLIQTQDK